MYKNRSISFINTALWHYLGTKHLNFKCENNSTPGRAEVIRLTILTLFYSEFPVIILQFYSYNHCQNYQELSKL